MVSEADRTAESPAYGRCRSEWDGHDVEIRPGKARRLMIEPQTCLIEIVWRDLERVVVTRAQLIDTLVIDVETDNRRPERAKATATGRPT